MRVLLTKSAVCVDEQPLGPHLDTAAMTCMTGAPLRSRDIPLHPSGACRVHVSSFGIVWYVNQPEDCVSHLFLALSPADTPEHPESAFTGSIRLNGVSLSSETSEATFPHRGDVEVRGHHHILCYETSAHHVAFGFKRPRNRIGKRSGVHRLAYVEVDFHSRSELAAAPNGGHAMRLVNSGVGDGPPSVS